MSFTAKELIESAPMLKYFAKEILGPQNFISKSIQAIELPDFMKHNYFWIGAHYAAGTIGSLTLQTIDLNIATKLALPFISSIIYGAKLTIYDALAWQKQSVLQEQKNKKMTTFDEFVEKCGIDIATHTMVGFVNSGVNKMMLGTPLTSIAYDLVIGITFSGMQCFSSYNQAITCLNDLRIYLT